MELLDKIHSKIDKTVKFVFKLDDDLITAASYINKDDGKDIICVASQTACKMGCKFCHTTDVINKVKVRNLKATEISDCVDYICSDISLGKRLLLVSYMGCGEPLLNWNQVLESMIAIRYQHDTCQFAIATMIPKSHWINFFLITEDIKFYKLNVKMHLSLHFTDEGMRKDWMPNALEIMSSIAALEFYKNLTGNSVEIHYCLIDGENDFKSDADTLGGWLEGRGIPVKLLQYNTRPELDYLSSTMDRVKGFMKILSYYTTVEYYVPPGIDIGSSCGMFLLDYYLKYNGVKNESK